MMTPVDVLDQKIAIKEAELKRLKGLSEWLKLNPPSEGTDAFEGLWFLFANMR